MHMELKDLDSASLGMPLARTSSLFLPLHRLAHSRLTRGPSPRSHLALLMGMGALGCIGPLMAGMNNEKRAQPVRLSCVPALFPSAVSLPPPPNLAAATAG